MTHPFNIRGILQFIDGLYCDDLAAIPVDYSWDPALHKHLGESRGESSWCEIYPRFDLADANRLLVEYGMDPVNPSKDNAEDEANNRLHDKYRDDEVFIPVMSCYYPLTATEWEHKPEYLQARLALYGGSCQLAELDDNLVLMLTGGGMDLSWDICTAYILAGQLPPVHFAAHLPEFAGKTLTQQNKVVLVACERALETMGNRCHRGLKHVRNLYKILKENSAKS